MFVVCVCVYVGGRAVVACTQHFHPAVAYIAHCGFPVRPGERFPQGRHGAIRRVLSRVLRVRTINCRQKENHGTSLTKRVHQGGREHAFLLSGWGVVRVEMLGDPDCFKNTTTNQMETIYYKMDGSEFSPAILNPNSLYELSITIYL